MGMKAAPDWPIEKPPASGYLVLLSNGQSILNKDIHSPIHAEKETNTATCLEENNHMSFCAF